MLTPTSQRIRQIKRARAEGFAFDALELERNLFRELLQNTADAGRGSGLLIEIQNSRQVLRELG